ncbi:amidase [Hansschlegelia zhihuaiae]|uniref:Amidase n=1 Tax=Hansschlegelia zhihuaiae TaxID=405005 RepID=A0A4Q0MPZ8_9HYPH|nr:amidase [Hansschlegelia zhihuaiae]RXF75166.1 amidase [Hansschlegelia zhihuaiae]
MPKAGTIAEIQAAIAGGADPQGLVTPLWERACALEPELCAFAHLPESAPAAGSGPLAGVTVGVKDLIDTADMPTAYGSPIHAGHRPTADAEIVSRLRALGATVLGKTVTTEFAWRHPGPTRNPWNRGHTPGGSSSGSAAAVAAGIVTLALGTQTLGSVIRPAAFCGVVGFKPSFGALPRGGVHPLCGALDHVGLFARAVGDVETAFALLTEAKPSARAGSEPLRLAALAPPNDVVSPDQAALFDATRRSLADAGAIIEPVEASDMLERIPAIADTLIAYEAAQIFGELREVKPDMMSGHLTALVDAGRATSEAAYRDALAVQSDRRQAFSERMKGYDALLAVPAIGEAPAGLASTGDARFCAPWTVLDAPAVSLPVGLSPSGLPLGLQLVGRPGADLPLLATAKDFCAVVPLIASAPPLP